jgi:hypothetical protein
VRPALLRYSVVNGSGGYSQTTQPVGPAPQVSAELARLEPGDEGGGRGACEQATEEHRAEQHQPAAAWVW